MQVVLRKMCINDMEMVRQWRMMPEVTKYMYTDPIITLEQQIKWYDKVSKSDELYWIVVQDGTPVGLASLVGWDKENNRMTGGAYIAVRNSDTFKLAIELQLNLLNYAFNVLHVNKVCGEVISENVGALKVLEMCGSVREGVLREHIYKNGRYYDVIVQSTIKSDWGRIKKRLKNIYEME